MSRITDVRRLPEERMAPEPMPLPFPEHPWHLCFCAVTSASERETRKGFRTSFPLTSICLLGGCSRIAHRVEISFSLTSICSLGALYRSDSSTSDLCRLSAGSISRLNLDDTLHYELREKTTTPYRTLVNFAGQLHHHREVARPRISLNPSSYQQVGRRNGTTHARGDSGSPVLDGCRLAQDHQAVG